MICLTLSGCWLISTMPPALSEMGPNTSMVSTYAAVDSIPIVATAVPNRPSAFDAVSPAAFDKASLAEVVRKTCRHVRLHMQECRLTQASFRPRGVTRMSDAVSTCLASS